MSIQLLLVKAVTYNPVIRNAIENKQSPPRMAALAPFTYSNGTNKNITIPSMNMLDFFIIIFLAVNVKDSRRYSHLGMPSGPGR
jgi:hypothetical protein